MLTGRHEEHRLAYTLAHRGGGTDVLLSNVAETLLADGFRVCGCIQRNRPQLHTDRCDMIVTTLPTGRELQISRDRGAGARGCRLDAGSLEQAVAEVEASLTKATDILIINKFGKHEANGRGFCETIGEAMASGIPTLVGVNALNLDCFLAFSGNLARRLEANQQALLSWASSGIAMGRGSDA